MIFWVASYNKKLNSAFMIICPQNMSKFCTQREIFFSVQTVFYVYQGYFALNAWNKLHNNIIVWDKNSSFGMFFLRNDMNLPVFPQIKHAICINKQLLWQVSENSDLHQGRIKQLVSAKIQLIQIIYMFMFLKYQKVKLQGFGLTATIYYLMT